MKLTLPAIVSAAIEVVETSGLDGLTTRALATALNVRSPSLYHHLASMEVLVDLIAVDMMERYIACLENATSWEDWLRRFATKGRAMTLSVRDGARIMTAPVPRSAARENIAEGHARYLVSWGFSNEAAYRALGMLSSFVAGWSLNEQNRHEWLASVMDPEANFHRCIDAIIVGIRHEYGPSARDPSDVLDSTSVWQPKHRRASAPPVIPRK